jgi:hypothetical protein
MWYADEGCPPSSNSIFWRNCEHFIAKLNVLFCAHYTFPVIVDCRFAAKRFVERCHLIGAIFCVQRSSTLSIAAWSSFAHGVVISGLGLEIASERSGFLIGSVLLVVMGAALIVLAPTKQSEPKAAAVAA